MEKLVFYLFGGGVVTDEPPINEDSIIVLNQVYAYNVKQQEFFEGNMQVYLQMV